jgi:hypothetical protein
MALGTLHCANRLVCFPLTSFEVKQDVLETIYVVYAPVNAYICTDRQKRL